MNFKDDKCFRLFARYFIFAWLMAAVAYTLAGCAESGLYAQNTGDAPTSSESPPTLDTGAQEDGGPFLDAADAEIYPEFDTALGTPIEEEKIDFSNIAAFATPSTEGSLFDYGEWALIDNNHAVGWYSKPQYFDWNPTWVQLEWEEHYNVTYLEIYWDGDLFADEVDIHWADVDGAWHQWSVTEKVSGNYSKFLLAKPLRGIHISMEGSSNMLSTYSIREIEVTGAQY